MTPADLRDPDPTPSEGFLPRAHRLALCRWCRRSRPAGTRSCWPCWTVTPTKQPSPWAGTCPRCCRMTSARASATSPGTKAALASVCRVQKVKQGAATMSLPVIARHPPQSASSPPPAGTKGTFQLSVLQDGPADRAGVPPGSWLLELNGDSVKSYSHTQLTRKVPAPGMGGEGWGWECH